MKRALPLLLAAVLLTAIGTAVPSATGTGSAAGRGVTARPDPKDPRSKRDKVRRERAAAAARLDALRADADDVDRAIDDLRANTRTRESELATARAAEQQANRNVADAQAEVDAVMARMSTLSAAAKKAAIMAFTSGGESELFSSLLGGGATDAPSQDLYYNLAVGDLQSALNDLEAAQNQLQRARAKADRAARAATKRREGVEQKLTDLDSALAQQEQLGRSIEDRFDEALSEAEGLADLDATLSKQVAARERAIVARARAAGIKGATVDKKGKIKVPVIPTSQNGLVRVNGVLMDRSIGDAFARLVALAAADGINLTGGGYRSAQAQINLRRGNCGPTDYDIWLRPPSECSPPAARPGRSMHEKGLAIDVRCNGRLISRYSDPCFAWMVEHAPRVGLHNDVTHREAWHWSTNGN
ncbi:MAG: hypothetical protein F2934_04975 [Actinobacteria bacterium]|uniref:Unannotated protein n=1 Tax=freshwater metagenome TaxID=449393 RepID=A0A6J6QJ40_9ZZZZ|nr:hypothetical protein [Actinomycetota bacterium]MSY12523.1 hypothetical protein [Actinomycetota bacterium]MSZ03527.1 hypothetical protein [Actinomycetota bacterium]MTB06468.1 hypothetical protein [Actinomycetota bacterium]